MPAAHLVKNNADCQLGNTMAAETGRHKSETVPCAPPFLGPCAVTSRSSHAVATCSLPSQVARPSSCAVRKQTHLGLCLPPAPLLVSCNAHQEFIVLVAPPAQALHKRKAPAGQDLEQVQCLGAHL